MSDRYQALGSTSVGSFVAKRLGLLRPPVLARYREGAPLVDDTVLVGAAPGGRAHA